MNKPFGVSLHLDLYDCKAGVADDLELTYRFLEELVDVLGMTKMSAPFVIHGPRSQGEELFPDKLGVSGFVPLIESGISIHSIEPTHFITIDCYSCRSFDATVVRMLAQKYFGPGHYEQHFLIRGKNYVQSNS